MFSIEILLHCQYVYNMYRVSADKRRKERANFTFVICMCYDNYSLILIN